MRITAPQRARITDCPHGGKHNGVDGYIVDTYADGSVAIDMGFNHTCITSGWENLPAVRREDVHVADDDLDDVSLEPTAPKRRGRPPKPKPLLSDTEPKAKRGRRPKEPSPLEKVIDEAETELAELHARHKPAAPASATDAPDPILKVFSVQGNRVRLSYRCGETSIEAINVSKDDLGALKTIIKALTAKGGQ